MSKYRINSIKMVDNTPQIDYSIINETESQEIKLECEQKAMPDFIETWQQLTPHFLDICELPKSWATPGTKDGERDYPVQVRKVSFSFSKVNDSLQLIMTGLRTLEHCNTPLNISSPLKSVPDVPYDELQGDARIYISDDLEQLIERINVKALAYINGDRVGKEQEDMFADEIAPITELEPVTMVRGKTRAGKTGKHNIINAKQMAATA